MELSKVSGLSSRPALIGDARLAIAEYAPMVNVAGAEQFEKNIDWNKVASYYDAYVRTDLDLSFFLKHARESGGPVLELMCGTGRITIPLIEAGYDVTSTPVSGLSASKIRTRRLAAITSIVTSKCPSFLLVAYWSLVLFNRANGTNIAPHKGTQR